MPSKGLILMFHPRTFHERNYRYFHVPYSLLSVASTIDRNKFDISLWDNNILKKDIFDSELRTISERLLCVGISSMIGHQIEDGLMFARQVKNLNPKIPIIWGGALPTVLPELTISHDLVDFVVVGQGQITFPELIESLAGSREFENIMGILFKRDGLIIRTPARPFENFGSFPRFGTVFDLISLDQYIRNDEHIASQTISYHSSQGCPFDCGFCSEVAQWNQKWGAFPPETVLKDFEYLITHHVINGIKLYDAEFFINKRRDIRIAEQLTSIGMNIRWGAAIHPLNLSRFTDAELKVFQRSGLSRLLIGAESGVEEELNLVGKRTDREVLLGQAKRCTDFGITASFTFITGYPGMSQANIDKTIEFAASLTPPASGHEAKIHFFAPYPGTPLYTRSLACGFMPPTTLEAWSSYDYYDIVTPWVERSCQEALRVFNEEHYPYIRPEPISRVDQDSHKGSAHYSNRLLYGHDK